MKNKDNFGNSLQENLLHYEKDTLMGSFSMILFKKNTFALRKKVRALLLSQCKDANFVQINTEPGYVSSIDTFCQLFLDTFHINLHLNEKSFINEQYYYHAYITHNFMFLPLLPCFPIHSINLYMNLYEQNGKDLGYFDRPFYKGYKVFEKEIIVSKDNSLFCVKCTDYSKRLYIFANTMLVAYLGGEKGQYPAYFYLNKFETKIFLYIIEALSEKQARHSLMFEKCKDVITFPT